MLHIGSVDVLEIVRTKPLKIDHNSVKEYKHMFTFVLGIYTLAVSEALSENCKLAYSKKGPTPRPINDEAAKDELEKLE
ncbi:unnamed protein product [Prunus armeniaca]